MMSESSPTPTEPSVLATESKTYKILIIGDSPAAYMLTHCLCLVPTVELTTMSYTLHRNFTWKMNDDEPIPQTVNHRAYRTLLELEKAIQEEDEEDNCSGEAVVTSFLEKKMAMKEKSKLKDGAAVTTDFEVNQERVYDLIYILLPNLPLFKRALACLQKRVDRETLVLVDAAYGVLFEDLVQGVLKKCTALSVLCDCDVVVSETGDLTYKSESGSCLLRVGFSGSRKASKVKRKAEYPQTEDHGMIPVLQLLLCDGVQVVLGGDQDEHTGKRFSFSRILWLHCLHSVALEIVGIAFDVFDFASLLNTKATSYVISNVCNEIGSLSELCGDQFVDSYLGTSADFLRCPRLSREARSKLVSVMRNTPSMPSFLPSYFGERESYILLMLAQLILVSDRVYLHSSNLDFLYALVVPKLVSFSLGEPPGGYNPYEGMTVLDAKKLMTYSLSRPLWAKVWDCESGIKNSDAEAKKNEEKTDTANQDYNVLVDTVFIVGPSGDLERIAPVGSSQDLKDKEAELISDRAYIDTLSEIPQEKGRCYLIGIYADEGRPRCVQRSDYLLRRTRWLPEERYDVDVEDELLSAKFDTKDTHLTTDRFPRQKLENKSQRALRELLLATGLESFGLRSSYLQRERMRPGYARTSSISPDSNEFHWTATDRFKSRPCDGKPSPPEFMHDLFH